MIILNVPGTFNGLGKKNCLAVIFCRPGITDIVLVNLPGGSQATCGCKKGITDLVDKNRDIVVVHCTFQCFLGNCLHGGLEKIKLIYYIAKCREIYLPENEPAHQ